MRLLHTETFKFKEFYLNTPEYAILSHTWGDDELTLQKWLSLGSGRQEKANESAGLKKILQACEQARRLEMSWIWIDTICIDKTSSAELSETINSMFAWYRDSHVCLAYLVDVEPFLPLVDIDGVPALPADMRLRDHLEKEESGFRSSRWFTRGWTLQELLAPEQLFFFARDWALLGTLDDGPIYQEVEKITGIIESYLNRRGSATIFDASVAERLSWASNRVTTRVEDIAYCLLGILDVNMPLLYGEGPKAFVRLQQELIKISNDHTIFTWTSMPEILADHGDLSGLDSLRDEAIADGTIFPDTRLRHIREQRIHRIAEYSGMLAPDPIAFYEGRNYMCSGDHELHPFAITNAGLSIRAPLLTHPPFISTQNKQMLWMVLACTRIGKARHEVCLMLEGDIERSLFRRAIFPRCPVLLSPMAIAKDPLTERPKPRKIMIARDTAPMPSLFSSYYDTRDSVDKALSTTCCLHLLFPEGLQHGYYLQTTPVAGGGQDYMFPDGSCILRKQGIILFSISRRRPDHGRVYSLFISVRSEAFGVAMSSATHRLGSNFVFFVGVVVGEDHDVRWYIDLLSDSDAKLFSSWRHSRISGAAAPVPTNETLDDLEGLRASPGERISAGAGRTSGECEALIGERVMFGPDLPGAVMEIYLNGDGKLRDRKEVAPRGRMPWFDLTHYMKKADCKKLPEGRG